MVGGLMVSQVLTLFTTPVIYLWFDRLAARARAWRDRRFGTSGPPDDPGRGDHGTPGGGSDGPATTGGPAR